MCQPQDDADHRRVDSRRELGQTAAVDQAGGGRRAADP